MHLNNLIGLDILKDYSKQSSHIYNISVYIIYNKIIHKLEKNK